MEFHLTIYYFIALILLWSILFKRRDLSCHLFDYMCMVVYNFLHPLHLNLYGKLSHWHHITAPNLLYPQSFISVASFMISTEYHCHFIHYTNFSNSSSLIRVIGKFLEFILDITLFLWGSSKSVLIFKCCVLYTVFHLFFLGIDIRHRVMKLNISLIFSLPETWSVLCCFCWRLISVKSVVLNAWILGTWHSCFSL